MLRGAASLYARRLLCPSCRLPNRQFSTSPIRLVHRPQEPYEMPKPRMDAYGRNRTIAYVRDDDDGDELAIVNRNDEKVYEELQMLAEPGKVSWYEKYGSHDGYGLKNKTKYRMNSEGKLEPWESAGANWKEHTGYWDHRKGVAGLGVHGFQRRHTQRIGFDGRLIPAIKPPERVRKDRIEGVQGVEGIEGPSEAVEENGDKEYIDELGDFPRSRRLDADEEDKPKKEAKQWDEEELEDYRPRPQVTRRKVHQTNDSGESPFNGFQQEEDRPRQGSSRRPWNGKDDGNSRSRLMESRRLSPHISASDGSHLSRTRSAVDDGEDRPKRDTSSAWDRDVDRHHQEPPHLDQSSPPRRDYPSGSNGSQSRFPPRKSSFSRSSRSSGRNDSPYSSGFGLPKSGGVRYYSTFRSFPRPSQASASSSPSSSFSAPTLEEQQPPSALRRAWKPAKKLSYAAMAGLKELHRLDPERHDRKFLSHKFGISFEAVSRILKSNYRQKDTTPSNEARPITHTQAVSAEKPSLRGTKWDPNPETAPQYSPVPSILRARGK